MNPIWGDLALEVQAGHLISAGRPEVQRLPKILDHHQIRFTLIDLRPSHVTTVPSNRKARIIANDSLFAYANLIDLARLKIVKLNGGGMLTAVPTLK